eukprot:403355936
MSAMKRAQQIYFSAKREQQQIDQPKLGKSLNQSMSNSPLRAIQNQSKLFPSIGKRSLANVEDENVSNFNVSPLKSSFQKQQLSTSVLVQDYDNNDPSKITPIRLRNQKFFKEIHNSHQISESHLIDVTPDDKVQIRNIVKNELSNSLEKIQVLNIGGKQLKINRHKHAHSFASPMKNQFDLSIMDLNRIQDTTIDEDLQEDTQSSRPQTFNSHSTVKDIYLSSTPSELSSEREINEQKLYGKDALKNYRNKYFKSSKLLQISEMKGRKMKDPLVKYLSQVNQKGMLPRGMGLLHRRENVKQINIKSFYVRDAYIEAFTQGINASCMIEEINFNNIGLTTNRAIKLITNINKQRIKTLDLSHNPLLTKEFYHILSEYLDDPITELRRLVLEGNKMGDYNLEILTKVLCDNNKVSYLNLSKNEITNLGADFICKMLYYNTSINVLFLHWNRILPKGGQALAKTISSHKTLQILDLSFNNIGSGINTIHNQFENPKLAELNAKIWKECLEQNQSLLHVDLTHNSLNSGELEIIAQGLQNNHTILGIHMLGNEGETDTQGFVKVIKKKQVSKSHVYTRIQPSLQAGNINNKQLLKLKACSNCWICEGWTEVKFEFKPGVSDDNPVHDKFQPIYLHLECDNFQSDLMLPDPDDPENYISIRWVPPGVQRYFFSRNDIKTINQTQQLSPVKPKVLNNQNLINLIQRIDSNSQVEEIDVPATNIIENIAQNRTILEGDTLDRMVGKPRLAKSLVQRDKVKTPWDFFKSVFKDYKADNPLLLNNCFEHDWSCTKLEKIIKDLTDQNKTKEFLRTRYKLLRDAYKYYSGVDPVGNVCCIGTNVFTEMVSNCGDMIDQKTLKLSDLDLEFVATKSGPKKSNPRNPERQLIRYQFMEVFVRLAGTKFIKSGICTSFYDAVVKIFNDFLDGQFKKFDSDIFRKQKLWNEECDLSFKRNLKGVQALYTKYSGKYAMPGAPRFMSMDEFSQLIQDSSVISDSFGEREISPVYALSMMTQKDEIESDRHMNMVQVEFIEAIGRVAEKVNIPHYIEDLDEASQTIIPSSNLRTRPLDIKIEALILQMVRACLGIPFFNQYVKQLQKIKEAQKNTHMVVQGQRYNK